MDTQDLVGLLGRTAPPHLCYQAPHSPLPQRQPPCPGPRTQIPPVARVAGAVPGRGKGPADAHWRGRKASGARAGAEPRGGAAIRTGRWRPEFACSPAELREARPAPGPPLPAAPASWPTPARARPASASIRAGGPASTPSATSLLTPVQGAVGGAALRRACGSPHRLLLYLPQHPIPASPEEAVPTAGSPACRSPALSSPALPLPALPGAQPGRSSLFAAVPSSRGAATPDPPTRSPGLRRLRAPSALTELGARGRGDASIPPPSTPSSILRSCILSSA